MRALAYSVRIRDDHGEDTFPPCDSCDTPKRRRSACPHVPTAERRAIAWSGAAGSPHLAPGHVERDFCPAGLVRTRFVGEVWRLYRAYRKGALPSIRPGELTQLEADALLVLDSELDAAEAERLRRR